MIDKMVQKVKDKIRNKKKDEESIYCDDDKNELEINNNSNNITDDDNNDSDMDENIDNKDNNTKYMKPKPAPAPKKIMTFPCDYNSNISEDDFCQWHEERLKERVCNYFRDFETKMFIYNAYISFRRLRLQIISRIYERYKFRVRRETQIMTQLAKSRAETMKMVTEAASDSMRELGKAKIMLNYVEELKRSRGMITFARRLSEYRIAQIYDEMSKIILTRIALVFGWDPTFRFKLHRPLPENLPDLETLTHLILNSDKCRAIHPTVVAYIKDMTNKG